MISKERKEEIMAEVAYEVNKWISKQSIVSMALEDLDEDEADWYLGLMYERIQINLWRGF